MYDLPARVLLGRFQISHLKISNLSLSSPAEKFCGRAYLTTFGFDPFRAALA
jgi:hypothetical protein